jgi:TatD DNase family protein
MLAPGNGPMLIDTHCHLDFNRFDPDRDEVIARAHSEGVSKIIVPAIDLQNATAVLALCEQHPDLRAAVGVHPNSTAGWQAEWIEQIRALAQLNQVVAIGEIGLDYYWDESPHEVQHGAFTDQLELAAELQLPVIIHNREASADLLRFLAGSSLSGQERAGVLHSFSATLEVAQEAIAMGFYIGITGPVTFKKADDLRRIVAALPLDRILVETDAPFLAPQQRRGKRNEPSFVRYVAEKIAEIHDMSSEEMARITTANAARLFGQRLLRNEQFDA